MNLDELQALYEQATQGPWELEETEHDWEGDESLRIRAGIDLLMGNPWYYPYVPDNAADWRLIVALINAFPALRAELLEARQLLREASGTIDDVCVKTDVYLGIGEAHDRVRKWEAAYSAWEAKWTVKAMQERLEDTVRQMAVEGMDKLYVPPSGERCKLGEEACKDASGQVSWSCQCS